MTGSVSKAHRLLAPRIAYLIGTRDDNGVSNVIPVSNVTSVSTDPQQILVAVYKQWWTYKVLLNTTGFTLSVPLIDHLPGVWILGAQYSGYPAASAEEKLAASDLCFDHGTSPHGPVLTDGLGWMHCNTIARIDLGGDHGLIFGHVRQVWFNPAFLDSDGVPRDQTRPLMQATGNSFTTSTYLQKVPYYNRDS